MPRLPASVAACLRVAACRREGLTAFDAHNTLVFDTSTQIVLPILRGAGTIIAACPRRAEFHACIDTHWPAAAVAAHALPTQVIFRVIVEPGIGVERTDQANW